MKIIQVKRKYRHQLRQYQLSIRCHPTGLFDLVEKIVTGLVLLPVRKEIGFNLGHGLQAAGAVHKVDFFHEIQFSLETRANTALQSPVEGFRV